MRWLQHGGNQQIQEVSLTLGQQPVARQCQRRHSSLSALRQSVLRPTRCISKGLCFVYRSFQVSWQPRPGSKRWESWLASWRTCCCWLSADAERSLGWNFPSLKNYEGLEPVKGTRPEPQSRYSVFWAFQSVLCSSCRGGWHHVNWKPVVVTPPEWEKCSSTVGQIESGTHLGGVLDGEQCICTWNDSQRRLNVARIISTVNVFCCDFLLFSDYCFFFLRCLPGIMQFWTNKPIKNAYIFIYLKTH